MSALNEPVYHFYNVLQAQTNLFIRLPLDAICRSNMIGTGCSYMSDPARHESFPNMFFNVSHEDREQTQILPVQHHHAISLELVECVHQRLQVKLAVPVGLALNRNIEFYIAEESVGFVEEQPEPPSLRLIGRNKVPNQMRG